jgi:hypothetical protein
MSAMVFPLLAGLVLNKLINNFVWDKDTRQKFFIAIGVTGGLCLLFWLAPGMFTDFLKPNSGDENVLVNQYHFPKEQVSVFLSGVTEARAALVSSDALRSLVFIVLAGGLTFVFMTKRIKKEVFIAGMAVLILVDQFSVAKRFINDKSFVPKRTFTASFTESEADQLIKQDPDLDYRVLGLDNPFNDATISYFHKSLGGYHGAKLKRFQEMRDSSRLDGIVQYLGEGISKGQPAEILLASLQSQQALSTINMMNTKYFLGGNPDGRTAKDVIKNPYALGSVWFVKGIYPVQTADAEIQKLRHFNPADTAIVDVKILDGKFGKYLEGFTPSPDPAASIKLVDYKPNDLKYTSKASKEQFAVFSEVFYDDGLGWHAYIDGQKQPHIRVNYLLRGMRIPAGEHTIEFKFEPHSFAMGETITFICSLILLFGLIGAVVYEYMQYRKKGALPQAA